MKILGFAALSPIYELLDQAVGVDHVGVIEELLFLIGIFESIALTKRNGD
jgi:hypothetical protein